MVKIPLHPAIELVPGKIPGCRPRFALAFPVCLLASVLLVGEKVPASTVLSPWIPIFKGVERAAGTNTSGGGAIANNLQVVNAIRVDLTDPDVRLFTTPRISNYSANYTEVAGSTTTNFLKKYALQVAINANNFHDPGTLDSPSYTAPEGTAFNATGELVCTGQVVSLQESAVDASTFRFNTNNQPTFIPTNWPASSPAGANFSVSGLYAVLVNGVNIGSNYLSSSDFVHQVNPRTAFGLSKDKHYMYLLTIDGRQSGYSDGALDWETAAWLLKVGAWEGANMDGGGSTCLVMADSTGQPVELNHSSAIPSVGRERTVGCHLGLFAKPVPGFINDVSASPSDTSATITWTTLAPASTQVQYGLTTNLGSYTPLLPAPVTNHVVVLTNLSLATGYYFQAISTVGSTQYVSSNLFFVTLGRHHLFGFDNSWTYSTANLDSTNWTAPTYDDSSWDGSGPGLLWVDSRGPNGSIPVPLLTQMTLDQAGNPFPTYYFRTHFTLTNILNVTSLLFEDYLDDGAVFYLNGTELYRLRMPASPAQIQNVTLASVAPPCGGNATCPDNFMISGDLLTNLLAGDNVLAAEVHNYNAASPDITFGLALDYVQPSLTSPQLIVSISNGLLTLSWSGGGFTLQHADAPAGTWTDVPGPVTTSPFTTSASASNQFYRLRN
jgi:hypothetical protein